MIVNVHAVNYKGQVLDDSYSVPFNDERQAAEYAVSRFVQEMRKRSINDISQIAAVANGKSHIYTWLEAICL